LEAPVASLVWRISIRQVTPGSSRPHNPQNAIEDLSILNPWSATTIDSYNWFGQQAFYHFPLFVFEIHGFAPISGLSPF
jgi:hypothetical protein